MFGGIKTAYAGGEGSIRCNSGKSNGLRNRRRAHWAKIHQKEIREKENKRKAAENADRDFGADFNFPM